MLRFQPQRRASTATPKHTSWPSTFSQAGRGVDGGLGQPKLKAEALRISSIGERKHEQTLFDQAWVKTGFWVPFFGTKPPYCGKCLKVFWMLRMFRYCGLAPRTQLQNLIDSYADGSHCLIAFFKSFLKLKSDMFTLPCFENKFNDFF